MGRHSSPEQGLFYRSLAGWIVVWVVIAVITVVAVVAVVNAIGTPEVANDAANSFDPEPAAPAATTTTAAERVRTPRTPTTASDGTNEDVRLITDGVTLQILNGTISSDAGEVMAGRLSRLGYEVVAIEESSVAYKETTVFWSYEDSEKAAVALAERFGWLVKRKPANLSDEVAAHVVVGADEG